MRPASPDPCGVCRRVRGEGGPFSRAGPDHQASIWRHRLRGHNIVRGRESFPGELMFAARMSIGAKGTGAQRREEKRLQAQGDHRGFCDVQEKLVGWNGQKLSQPS